MDIRFVTTADKRFWYSLDKHLPEAEFEILKDMNGKDRILLVYFGGGPEGRK